MHNFGLASISDRIGINEPFEHLAEEIAFPGLRCVPAPACRVCAACLIRLPCP